MRNKPLSSRSQRVLYHVFFSWEKPYTLHVMEITPEALKEFKKIYEEDYQETITDAEALEMAQRVLDFFSIVARPLPEEWCDIEKTIPNTQSEEKLDFDNYK